MKRLMGYDQHPAGFLQNVVEMALFRAIARLLILTQILWGLPVTAYAADAANNGAVVVQAPTDLKVSPTYQLISSKRITRTLFDFTYKVQITNSGAENFGDVVASVTSNAVATTIIDGSVSFGEVAPGATVTSQDTFTLRQDRTILFNPADLVWTVIQANRAPVANAGDGQTIAVGATVHLDGSRSSDSDGNSLDYAWKFVIIPPGSTASLSDAASVKPSFTADRPGTYVVQLIANDGKVSSPPDEVTISTTNTPPVADVRLNQPVRVGQTAQLDGSHSSDVDGNTLTFKWTLVNQPAGSTTALSDPIAVQPALPIDKAGQYTVELVVDDGIEDSETAQLIISTENTAPVANAGADRPVKLLEKMILDGSASNDIDGDTLSFLWSLTRKPVNSSASLSDPSLVKPEFTADLPGDYIAQLIVNDGKANSSPDSVTLTTENTMPVANAGAGQTVPLNTNVTLDGSQSSDAENDPLTFQWSMTSTPSGSAAVLSDPNAKQPQFLADLPGSYIGQLIVNDGNLTSDPATVTISTENSQPVANAGADQQVKKGDTVQLDGANSRDADHDKLTFSWSLLKLPANSQAQLSDRSANKPTFVADQPGMYVVQLIVNDGHVNSDPDTALVTVSVAPPENHPPQITTSHVLNVTVGDSYNYDVDASDSDNDTLTYSLSAFPTDMSINKDTGLISWTPAAGQTGPQSVTVNVSDGKGGSDSQSFTVTVAAAGQITVPDLGNLSRAAAETAIQQARLNLGTLSFEHNAKANGSVINQSPAANSSVAEGAMVNLTISLGPDQNLPPNPATVAPVIDPTVATTTYASTQFIYSGSNPIQTGVQPGTIEARRVAVIRGKVLDKQNNPLSGVTLSILNHPEFGQTLSRADGLFDLAVNGGGYLTLNYMKDGYIKIQRQINTPWQDYALIEDASLIQLDSRVSEVHLSNATTVQVAQGNPVIDGDGKRQATLLFPLGTQATMTLADGSTSSLTDFHLRATEFTDGPNGPKTMPASLPPSTGYTYEVEYSVDEAVAAGASRVFFNHPIISYTDNFIGFPVGTLVPYGEYDRKKGLWIASDNGRVIKILNIIQGLAALDLDGSGQAASAAALAALGISAGELQKLAVLYPSGKSLWRVPIDHFLTIN